MSVVCICSMKDIAAQTIKHQLVTLFPFRETETSFDSHPIYKLDNLSIVTIESDSIYADHLGQQLNGDLIIFASRHKSAAFKPALLTHTPGNWGDAEMGGEPSKLCIAHPVALKIALNSLSAEQQRIGLENWAVGLEATHHGPWIKNTPVLFIEIGSTEKEWRNEKAAEIAARTIVTVSNNYTQTNPIVLGFGGPHYCPTFTRISFETKFAVSHVLPKYYLDTVSESLVHHALDRTAGLVSHAVLDWKGMKGSQRNKLLHVLDSSKLDVRRARDLLREANPTNIS